MNRGTKQPQDPTSSDWVTKILEELRRQLRETEPWPVAGDQLLADLSHLINSRPKTSSEEDYDMLEIVVNDALTGVDIMKKYPAFYARMLVDEELRNAFLDTLALLEERETEELPEFAVVNVLNMEVIKQVLSRPIIKKDAKEKIALVWKRTAEQLKSMLYLNTLKPRELLRSGDYLPGDGHLNILHSQVTIDNQNFDIRLEAAHDLTNPENLNLMIAIQLPDKAIQLFEATITWGSYELTAAVNQFGIAKFPPLRIDQIFTPDGELKHGLELHLVQVD